MACGFLSNITLLVGERKYNAKSIMNMPLLSQSEELHFVVEGLDEHEVAKKIKEYFEE